MAYADYDFYKNEYRGTLTEADFTRFAERASDYIDMRTEYIFQKSSVPEELTVRVKKACCAVAEVMKNTESGGVKTSESVGDHSVSYAVGTRRTDAQKLDDALQLYLADVIKAVKWL